MKIEYVSGEKVRNDLRLHRTATRNSETMKNTSPTGSDRSDRSDQAREGRGAREKKKEGKRIPTSSAEPKEVTDSVSYRSLHGDLPAAGKRSAPGRTQQVSIRGSSAAALANAPCVARRPPRAIARAQSARMLTVAVHRARRWVRPPPHHVVRMRAMLSRARSCSRPSARPATRPTRVARTSRAPICSA